MKAIGRKTIFASPGLTNSSITSGIDVVGGLLARRAGEVSPYSMISTGASGSPRTLPGLGHALELGLDLLDARDADDGASSSPARPG